MVQYNVRYEKKDRSILENAKFGAIVKNKQHMFQPHMIEHTKQKRN